MSKDITFSSSFSCFSTRKRKGVDNANYVIIAMYTAVETTIILLINDDNNRVITRMVMRD